MGFASLNYYEVLDISPVANQQEIDLAYAEARKTFSLSNSDLYKVFSKDEANAWLNLIEEAYSVIGVTHSRKAYDRSLGSPEEAADLPSLELEETQPQVQKIKVETLEDTALAPGMAQTKISQYTVNKKMEELIRTQDIFDGLFLKKVREYKKIELPDFSSHTCIAIRHLYAIENNNFSVLPAAVFVRGYIIQYCRVLDLPQERVVDSFMNLFNNEK